MARTGAIIHKQNHD